MLPIIRVLGLTLQAPPLAVMLGLLLGLALSSRLAARRGLDGDAISNAGFYGALAGVLGARAGYVLTNVSAYAREPLSALMPNTTALLAWAGWPVGLAFAAWYLWRRRMLRPELPDVLAPGALVFAIGLALAAFLNGDAFGVEAQLPWSVYLWGAARHPVQLYEVAALAAVLAVSLVVARRAWPAGVPALLCVALVAMARVLVDGFRADVPIVLGMRITQLAGVVIASVALWLLGDVLAAATRDNSAVAGDGPAPVLE
jgi:phosphatidylglycerol---prolipoprotein diacylglyceryl transferase